jgi:hypothetical protein
MTLLQREGRRTRSMMNKKEAIILTGVISRLLAPVPGNLCFLGRSRCALSIGCSFAFGHGKVEFARPVGAVVEL